MRSKICTFLKDKDAFKIQNTGVILQRYRNKKIHYLLLKTNRLEILFRLDCKANLF